ncbi:uncharacterized protein L3040_002310 [Drepanopeziza brunnea f. sp. 'multigermtubi']|uniref:uncharacterized protein n=1 Tax=Drepanopeziza brunnea f. sp. 'multigermtubi' TaxID=698441 RepID=UPI0023A59323|nr:hypothetical protein L3040_002310 [Drepanopeziza brunnea f. sp. 'multigermtubi']
MDNMFLSGSSRKEVHARLFPEASCTGGADGLSVSDTLLPTGGYLDYSLIAWSSDLGHQFPVPSCNLASVVRVVRLAGDRILPIIKWLPFNLGHFVGFGHFFEDRYRAHQRLGPVFSIVSPGRITLVVADPKVANDILVRRKDFVVGARGGLSSQKFPRSPGIALHRLPTDPPAQKSKSVFKTLEIFGPNVDTLNGEAWQRHRRLTTPPFNERNSNLVWRASIFQASGMLQSWLSAGGSGVTKTPSDVMTLALHVLTAAVFGKTHEYEGGLTKLSDNHTTSYKDSLRIILSNIFLSYIVKANLAPTYMPKSMVEEVGNALEEFQQYMEEMVEEEKTKTTDSTKDTRTLISALVRASESEKQGGGRTGLTDKEMYGNLFIYNLAGHDTTANTIAYAIYLMASDERWQAWIREELDSVFGDRDNVSEDDYERAFPQLKRCLALMYETLRLYGPVVMIPKHIEKPTKLVFNGTEHLIPQETTVIVNVTALCTSPEYWGPDTMTWRPDRWITSSGQNADLQTEEIKQPASKKAFVPWATGPRVCPGKKFSQVEFVAVIALLFRKHRVAPEMKEGESKEDVKRKVLDTVEDSRLVMTLRMNNPERVKLIWEAI